MPYSKSYMSIHDIDWYARINGSWIYASSMGGNLPGRVNNNIFLPLMQVISSNLPLIVDRDRIEVNERLIEQRYERARNLYGEYYGTNEEELAAFLETFTLQSFKIAYTEHFVDMACRGFISYIRYDIDDIFNNDYSYVARPPEDISQELTRTFDSPLPVWLRSKEYDSFLQQINVSIDAVNLFHDDIQLWEALS